MKTTLITFILSIIWTACSAPQRENESTSNESVSFIESPAGENASLPYLVTGEDGNLYFSWVEKKDSNWVELKYSIMKDDSWSEPQLIAKGNDWFVNWADYPMLAVDKDGNMISNFLAKSTSGTYSYDVNIVYKPADGEWSDPIIPHKDGTPTEHGFVTMLPKNDGRFLLSWLDGRNTGGGDHGSEDGHVGGGAMTIRTAALDMQGNLTEEAELDNRVCDCCQTGGAMTASGPVIAYRDRSEEEIRDISFVKLVNQKWSEPQTVNTDNWEIAGCPVNGPRMTSSGSTIAIAWFSAAEGNPKVNIAFSDDDGSFKEPIIVDDTKPLGRVDIILLDEETAVVSWLDNEGTPAIKYKTIKSDGTSTEPMILSETSDSRGSGFPQMTIVDGTTYFAWTSYDKEKGTEVKMAKLF
ncbi:MAG: exo-alpha-sialidase [Cyclobacteriaceae bacterium]